MDLSKVFPLKVEAETPLRLDQYLSRAYPEVSRSRWTKVILDGLISVNGKKASPSLKVSEGMEVSCSDPRALVDEKVEDQLLNARFNGVEPEVIFEDEDILVINKPVGLTVHPGHGIGVEDTLVGWLLASEKVRVKTKKDLLKWGEDVIEEARPGIVHRLDRGTSGVMVVAKNPKAHKNLSEQFAERAAGRLYWAVVAGSVENLYLKRPPRVEAMLRRAPCPIALRLSRDGPASIASFLDRDASDRTRFGVSLGSGRRAVTHLVEIAKNETYSVLELKLETGRTHQIRVHMSFLGFPLLGDDLYGGRSFERMMLHAHTLHLRHPQSGERRQFQAAWPAAGAAWLAAQHLELSSRAELWASGPTVNALDDEDFVEEDAGADA